MTLRDEILAEGRRWTGTPYGLPPGPGQLDCSKFIEITASGVGVGFPGTVRTAEQLRQASVPIALADLLPADLLFWQRTYDATEAPGPDGKLATHVGWALDDGAHQMLDANDARGNVGVTQCDTAWWQAHWLEARRLPALAGTIDTGGNPDMTLPVLPRGIDVSSNNGAIDWDAVATAGLAFAAIKVTEDTGYLNPNFEYDWAGAKRIKLARIAYHYARPEGADADDEAAWMLDQIDAHGGLEVGDLLWLDLEAGSGDLGGWSLEFLRHTQERAGFKPIVYSGAWFTSQHNLAAYPALADYGLSLAAYQDEMPAPPPPWPFVAFWQYSDKGRIPGINGDVDLDVFNGRADRIRAYGKPGAAGPTVTVPVQPLPDELAAARAQIAERDALITSLRSDLADRNSKLGAAGVDYAGQLRQIADRLAELKPTA